MLYSWFSRSEHQKSQKVYVSKYIKLKKILIKLILQPLLKQIMYESLAQDINKISDKKMAISVGVLCISFAD